MNSFEDEYPESEFLISKPIPKLGSDENIEELMSFHLKIDDLKMKQDAANGTFVLGSKAMATIKELGKMSESMMKGAHAGEILRHKIIESNLVPDDQIIHIKQDQPFFMGVDIGLGPDKTAAQVYDADTKEVIYDWGPPKWMNMIYPFKLNQISTINFNADLCVYKRDYSKVFQFRIRKAPRYLRRFK